MQVLTDLDGCPRPAAGSVVTIGVYDGVHVGHRALLQRVTTMASALGCTTAVVTFDPHPAAVVRPESAPLLLTDLPQRLELLEDAGLDNALVVRFDRERSTESPEEFASEILVRCLRTRAVVVGHDFHFGHGRRGNVALLQQIGADHGFDVLGLTLTAESGEVVSSTRIRNLLSEGDVVEAARLLGRHHEVRGVVQRGDRRGRELGFPTANVVVPDGIQLPGDGIYAGWYVRPDGEPRAAAISLGRRPTFYADTGARLLEAYLLDFDGDLYDEPARVRFVSRLRGEERFESVDELVDQMTRDVDEARARLSNDGIRPPGRVDDAPA